MSIIAEMMRSEQYGMQQSGVINKLNCRSCVMAKNKQSRCTGKLVTKSRTLTIHADICGPMQTTSSGGGKYFLAMTTVEEKYARVHILKTLKNIEERINSYMNWLERHTEKKVGRVHTDNAPEFVRMRTIINKMGLTLTTSSTYTPQANGLTERMNGILLDKARCMLEHSG